MNGQLGFQIYVVLKVSMSFNKKQKNGQTNYSKSQKLNLFLFRKNNYTFIFLKMSKKIILYKKFIYFN